MTRITQHFTNDHRACDEIFAMAEAALGKRDPAQAARAFAQFRTLIEAHFGAEEEVLFPGFEKATGMAGGPTAMMRAEHMQIRALCDTIAHAIEAGSGTAGELADTLFALLQSHNMKEEQILYPMCDRTLGAQDALLAEAVARLGKEGIPR